MTTYCCGIDIGGTKMAVGIVTPEGETVALCSTGDHVRHDESGVMDLAADLVRQACAEAGIAVSDLTGVGVGMAGHMRSRDGIVLFTSNLDGFAGYPLTRELSSRLGGIRIILENDANCQAWAEYRYGAGMGHDDMVFVTVSTGIGAGIIINGRLYRGRTGTAGEIGHTIVEPNSDIACTCGNKGCFMALASTLNLDNIARQKSQRLPTRMFLNPNAHPGGRLDGRHIMAHARDGDAVALAIINEYADYLGIMLYNIFQIFNPSAIILGGGLMNWEFGYFERMQDKFTALAGDMLHDPMTVAKASIGAGSGVLGAASLLLDG
ncbi:MAG: ROK family protein [Planctomycetaceae bacterium]|nr:ROK family protein [Planctomycetaceae bacterium]